MGKRVAKPIERLLKIKTIDPNFVFHGADKKAYDDFIEKQSRETLLTELKKREQEAPKPKRARKVKQIVPKEIVETGAVESFDSIKISEETLSIESS